MQESVDSVTRAMKPDARRGIRRFGGLAGGQVVLLVALLVAPGCGDGGGSKAKPARPASTTATSMPSNPVFVAAGTSEAGSPTRQLRLSVGSPLPIASASSPSNGLALGPNAVRP